MISVEWYFDFISPFSYLQLESFDQLPRDVEIIYRPIVFAGLLNHLQHKGPAEIPAKRRFTYRYVHWLARHQGIPFRFPPAHPFNPIRALRLAVALGNDKAAIQKIFRFIWRDGHAVDADWKLLQETLGVSDAETLISAQPVKDELRQNGERAIAIGVFGVPTFVAGKEIFWGYDSTAMVAAYLQDPQAFDDSEMLRVSDLPATASRI
jgi:2-hydroxychromene-2-carboxylate isomerase